MPKQCIAYGCGNTNNDKVSLFSFPKDPELRQKWIANVKRTRDKWKGPTKNSFLCSCHFTADCIQTDVVMAASLGLPKKCKLKPDAIPTIFERPSTCTNTTSSRSLRYERRKQKFKEVQLWVK